MPEDRVVTCHCLVVDPPEPERSLPGLVEGSLDPDQAAALHEAALKDAMVAAARSGGDLLVNYPAADRSDEEDGAGQTPEAALRDLAEAALEDPDEARFEVQVGSTFAARAGNAATHLLAEEDSVAILRGTAPTLDRTALDGAAMKLRRHEVVLGPGSGGRAAYLGLSEPIDFDRAYQAPSVGSTRVDSPAHDRRAPEVEDLAARGVAAGHEVAFLAHHPVIEDEAGLAAAVAEIRARLRAGRNVPEHTAGAVEELGLRVVESEGVRRVVADG